MIRVGVFCDILAGRGEASVVHEDEHVVAFMDIQPVTEGLACAGRPAEACGLP